jgi:hypothetical protein
LARGIWGNFAGGGRRRELRERRSG